MEITKSPMMTLYGSLFYALLAIIYSFIPVDIIYTIPLVHILIVNILFFTGALFIGAPFEFMVRYTFTNSIGNLLFIQIFGGLLRLVF